MSARKPGLTFFDMNLYLIHILIFSTSMFILYKVYFFDLEIIKRTLFSLLVFNNVSFYIILLLTNKFNLEHHLPLHLCYITEIFLLISFLFGSIKIYPWLALNSMLGGIVGFLSTNLTSSSLFIEIFHYYLSHFSLLLFTLLIFKSKFYITIKHLLKSILANVLILNFIIIYNIQNGSNYWFTNHKPSGFNFSFLFPDWPHYILILIALGLSSYCLTFFLLINNKPKQ
tara:strand:+ start:454 stop:1137 length:684 start_codon:yes stop_codon:yes gene_type:complete